MKIKKLLFLVSTVLLITGISNAQTNLDFESWGPSTYGSNDPIDWGTLNADNIPGGPVSTIQETANPGNGSSSAKMVTSSGYASIGLSTDIFGGLVSIGQSPFVGDMGIPYTQKPTSIDLLYKENVAVGDTGLFLAQLTHWDGTGTVVDAQAAVYFYGSTPTWTGLNIPFTYFTSDTPDTLFLVATSSQYIFFGTPTPVVGSEIQIDNIVLNTGTPCPTPTANFTFTTNNLSASFSDASTTTGNVTYSWDFGDGAGTSSQQNPSYTYAGAGTYNVCLTITDDCGTVTSCQNVTVSAPCAPVSANITTANSGTSVDYSATIVGGTAPFTYTWTFTGGTPSSSFNLSETVNYASTGVYQTCFVASDGCLGPSAVDTCFNVVVTTCGVTVTSTDETTLGANDGTAIATATGTPPFAYLWSNGQTTSSVTGLSPGNYTISIMDGDSCISDAGVTINPGPAPCNTTVTVLSTDETGVGLNDGTATAVATNGTTPYTYLWSNGQTSSAISGLAPGVYTLIVIDSDSCFATGTATVQAYSCGLTGNTTSTDESGPGLADGTASVTVSGGTTPYTYLWSTGATTSSITGLSPNVYSVVVSDASGCTYTGSTAVNSAGCTLSISVSSTDETQAGANDGTAQVTPAGGTPPYFIFWDTGETTDAISGLSPGVYSVVVMDMDSCIEAATVTIGAGQIVGVQLVSSTESVLLVYPNPANDVIHFSIEENNSGEIFMYSMDGKLLKRKVMDGRKTSISIGDLPTGMYFYRVVHSNGSVLSGGKCIIAR